LQPDPAQVAALVKVLSEKKIGIVAHFYMDPEVRLPGAPMAAPLANHGRIRRLSAMLAARTGWKFVAAWNS
jgi:hypothetical protein